MDNSEVKDEAQNLPAGNPEQLHLMDADTHHEPVTTDEIAEVEIDAEDHFGDLSKDQLLIKLESFLEETDFSSLKPKIIAVKTAFDSLSEQEQSALLEKFIEEGGKPEEYVHETSTVDKKFSEVLRKVNRKKTAFLAGQEKQREQNHTEKREILKQLKELIQNEENMVKAFNAFHELQERWRNIGPVPPAETEDLWMTYRLYITKFYDLIKINRELQELDQKKNLEIKIRICEQAEEQMLEPSINKTLRMLGVLQKNWRETGVVPRDKRTELGERFKSACDKIIQRKNDFISKQKQKREESLKIKTELCERMEQLSASETGGFYEVREKFNTAETLFEEWKKSGFAEKAAGELAWKRFNKAMAILRKQKNDYFQHRKKEFQENLQAKTELCIQAEALSGNTNWKSTAEELRRLFEAWKKIGSAGKMSDKIWQRFKAASDLFYQSRNSHFAASDKEHEGNYQKKLKLLEQMEQFKPGEDKAAGLNQLKAFQREWTETGLVPLPKKDEINLRYKKLIEKIFNSINLSEPEKREFRLSEQIEQAKSSPRAHEKISDVKRGVTAKIAELSNEVQVWENNIGFFTRSKNADQIKKEFEEKINSAKKEIARLKEQLQSIKSF